MLVGTGKGQGLSSYTRMDLQRRFLGHNLKLKVDMQTSCQRQQQPPPSSHPGPAVQRGLGAQSSGLGIAQRAPSGSAGLALRLASSASQCDVHLPGQLGPESRQARSRRQPRAGAPRTATGSPTGTLLTVRTLKATVFFL